MSIADLLPDLDYQPLLHALIEKTRQGKLKWEATADESTFISSVKGQRGFVIRLQPLAPPVTLSKALLHGLGPGYPGNPIPLLSVKDETGKLLFETPVTVAGLPAAWELYNLARRVALRVDKEIDTTMQLLNQL